VVSRTIIDKKAGTVTLFAFDESQGLSEHTASYDALVYILDGEANVTISGKHIRLKKGEITIMPANEPHALKAVTRPYNLNSKHLEEFKEAFVKNDHPRFRRTNLASRRRKG
jgi:quercetin dioxygenase-like cupin family protein